MSRFANRRLQTLTPYVPGEQPRDRRYIKLNTNESPYPPTAAVAKAAAEAAAGLQLYCDPECTALTAKLAEVLGVAPTQVLCGNGSDESLNFAFMAFCDASTPAVFADITYGFYSVFAELHGVGADIVPLREDFSLSVDDYIGKKGTIFIANPNAPTGLALPRSEIERLLVSDPTRLVVIDEAYVDFGGESCIPLIDRYENLLVVGTFSKSRSLAGGRLGFAVGNEALIADLRTIKYSTNPYNINSLTAAAGLATLGEEEVSRARCREIMATRAWTTEQLQALGFTVLPSSTNFLFAKAPRIGGGELYLALKEKGILVRHFNKERISDFVRITIGTREQMERFLFAVKEIVS